MIIPSKIARLPIIWELRKLTLYSLSLLKALFKFRNVSLYDSAIYFSVWWKYQKKKNDPLKNDHPWITFKAEEFLRKILQKDMTVFEYGSGSSTLYFSRRVAHVYSIEHHLEWFEFLCKILKKKKIKNVDCRLIEPETLNENQAVDYFSCSPSYENKNFESYVKSIDTFPDEYFDIVMVDGRSRTACITHAKNKIKIGGYLIVDNSERAYYFSGNDFLKSEKEWESTHFTGPVPYTFEYSKTSFFQKLI
jgi:hypothetical protein